MNFIKGKLKTFTKTIKAYFAKMNCENDLSLSEFQRIEAHKRPYKTIRHPWKQI